MERVIPVRESYEPTAADMLCLQCPLPDCDEEAPQCFLYGRQIPDWARPVRKNHYYREWKQRRRAKG